MQAKLNAQLNRQLQTDSQLSLSDFAVLVLLTDVPEGQLRASQLAHGLHWEKSRVSHHVTRMERRGLVKRVECPEDGRSAFVVITECGRRAIEAAAPLHVETVRRLFIDDLTPEQLKTLEAIATQVLARLDAEEDAERAVRGTPHSPSRQLRT
ncbi:MarR family transcriptional regulator [Phytoactinopolyspora sp. XMNu-373]|uniref:MarR family transcriptional regulator n=2 Tax=Phytoactinopolyspora mesophila TaxID=2650750 RepID=A0A7K3M978_9ACTN|nr:MarR family transcriptional regulator [Phytoactinopolyspora mesophila]NDL58968.1 MarR family transcriptional regulator [Phytoactinopolyspora mesophila]